METLAFKTNSLFLQECEASCCPKPPTFEQTRRFPLTVNDEGLTGELSKAFTDVFGTDFTPSPKPVSASEDFSDLATSINKPYCFWTFGGIDADKWDKAEKEGRIAEDIPANHSALFAPVIQPTLRTGVECLCAAALTELESAK